MCVHIYIYIYICIYVRHIYIYIYTYTYTYTYGGASGSSSAWSTSAPTSRATRRSVPANTLITIISIVICITTNDNILLFVLLLLLLVVVVVLCAGLPRAPRGAVPEALTGNWSTEFLDYSRDNVGRGLGRTFSRKLPEISGDSCKNKTKFLLVAAENRVLPFAPVEFRRKPEPVPRTQVPLHPFDHLS